MQLLCGSVRASNVAPNLFDANLAHDATGTSLTLSPGGEPLRARVVVDATGFESRMVRREAPAAGGLWEEIPPGYQIAYGMRVAVAGGRLAPYKADAMTLFDYRTDHLQGTDMLADAEARPSFVYVMPYGDGKASKTPASEGRIASLTGVVTNPSLRSSCCATPSTAVWSAASLHAAYHAHSSR